LVDCKKILAGQAVGFSSPLRGFERSLSLELRCNGWDGGFLAHLHSPWGYDEPEILRYSNRQFAPIGADARWGERRLATDAAHPAASDEVKALRPQGMMISAGFEPSLLFKKML
jgi:hypothetical protein